MKNLILGFTLFCSPVFAAIENISADLMTRHTYVSDQDQYGVGDKWVMSLVGDCEDFALFSYFYLIGKGYDPQFWLVRTESGEMHAALTVDGYVFDNFGLSVFSSSNYKFIVEVKKDSLIRVIKK